MVSLKLSKKKKEEMAEPRPSDMPEYPWGSRLNLESEQVEKFSELQTVAVGDEMTATIKVRVKSVREDESETEAGKKRKRHDVELQVTDMEFVQEKKAPDAKKLYGKEG